MDWNECFICDEATGNLIWRTRPIEHFKNAHAHAAWNTKYAGSVVGGRRGRYLRVKVNRKRHLVHRIIYEMFNAVCLLDGTQVDHIDANPMNNRPCNLRAATHAQNQHNSRVRRDNRFGLKGVREDKRVGRYEAAIALNGRRIHLGTFSSPEEAHAAYCEAAILYHKEFARTA